MVEIRRPKQSAGERHTTRREQQGASQSKTTLLGRLRSWLMHNRQVAGESLQRLLMTPMASMMTWLVIGIALALPMGLYVALGNVEMLSRGWDGAAQISLFLRFEVTEAEGRQLTKKLALRADVQSAQYVSRREALEEFQSLSGFAEVLGNLDENPLPALVIVRPQDSDATADITEQLLQDLRKMPDVELAQLDLEWVQRLYAMMRLGRHMVMALASLLALGVLLVIGNTIRLAIENRRDEILVIKLVGGTDAFVRRPFLYTGMWFGLGGAITAWLIILLSLFWLSAPVAELAGLYDSQFALRGPGIVDTLGLWITGAILGLLGAGLAVNRHLDAIEPQ